MPGGDLLGQYQAVLRAFRGSGEANDLGGLSRDEPGAIPAKRVALGDRVGQTHEAGAGRVEAVDDKGGVGEGLIGLGQLVLFALDQDSGVALRHQLSGATLSGEVGHQPARTAVGLEQAGGDGWGVG